MKTTHYLVAAACAGALALMAGVASAQDDGRGPGAGMGPGMGMGSGMGMMMGRGMMGSGMMGGCPMMGAMMGKGGMMGMHSEGRVAFLKAELGITDAQKDAFEAYAAALRKNLGNMQAMHEGMLKMRDAKTPVERLDTHIGLMEGRLAALKEVKAPLSALYTSLSDEQRKKADDLLTGMGCMM